MISWDPLTRAMEGKKQTKRENRPLTCGMALHGCLTWENNIIEQIPYRIMGYGVSWIFYGTDGRMEWMGYLQCTYVLY